jgi:hypothetical protein
MQSESESEEIKAQRGGQCGCRRESEGKQEKVRSDCSEGDDGQGPSKQQMARSLGTVGGEFTEKAL